MNEDKTNKEFKMDYFQDINKPEVNPNQDLIDKLKAKQAPDPAGGTQMYKEDIEPGRKDGILDYIPSGNQIKPLQPITEEMLKIPNEQSGNQMGSRTPITKEMLDIPNPADILTPPLNTIPPPFEVVTKGHIARICHEANREYCRCLGDDSHLPWDSAPAWQKESAMKAVEANFINPLSPMERHNSWMKEKFDNGWKYGEVKDEEAKIHPCLVPYGDLPAEQQAKDFLFGSIVVGLQLFIKEG